MSQGPAHGQALDGTGRAVGCSAVADGPGAGGWGRVDPAGHHSAHAERVAASGKARVRLWAGARLVYSSKLHSNRRHSGPVGVERERDGRSGRGAGIRAAGDAGVHRRLQPTASAPQASRRPPVTSFLLSGRSLSTPASSACLTCVTVAGRSSGQQQRRCARHVPALPSNFLELFVARQTAGRRRAIRRAIGPRRHHGGKRTAAPAYACHSSADQTVRLDHPRRVVHRSCQDVLDDGVAIDQNLPGEPVVAAHVQDRGEVQ